LKEIDNYPQRTRQNSIRNIQTPDPIKAKRKEDKFFIAIAQYDSVLSF